jgi:hypothetical protein
MRHGQPTGNENDVATTKKSSNARITSRRTIKIDSPLETAQAKTVTTKPAIN